MNLMRGKDNISRVINDIIRQTQRMFGVCISREQLEEFAHFLEYDILNKIINANTDVIIYIKPGEVNDVLTSALIASGISKDGTLPKGEYYRKTLLETDINMRQYAEERLLGLTAFNFYHRVGCLDYERKIEYNKFPNMSELVDLLIIANEHLCEPGKVYNGDVATGMLAANFHKCMGFFEQYGINNNVACDICRQLYEGFWEPRHYGPFSREALREMAHIDMMITICGPGIVDLATIERVSGIINAARREDNELIEPLAKRFQEVIAPIVDGTNLKVYSIEEQVKRFTYVDNCVNLVQPRF